MTSSWSNRQNRSKRITNRKYKKALLVHIYKFTRSDTGERQTALRHNLLFLQFKVTFTWLWYNRKYRTVNCFFKYWNFMENTFTYKWEVNFGPRYGNGDTAIHTVARYIYFHVWGGKSQRREHLLLLLYTEIYICHLGCAMTELSLSVLEFVRNTL